METDLDRRDPAADLAGTRLRSNDPSRRGAGGLRGSPGDLPRRLGADRGVVRRVEPHPAAAATLRARPLVPRGRAGRDRRVRDLPPASDESRPGLGGGPRRSAAVAEARHRAGAPPARVPRVRGARASRGPVSAWTPRARPGRTRCTSGRACERPTVSRSTRRRCRELAPSPLPGSAGRSPRSRSATDTNATGVGASSQPGCSGCRAPGARVATRWPPARRFRSRIPRSA